MLEGGRRYNEIYGTALRPFREYTLPIPTAEWVECLLWMRYQTVSDAACHNTVAINHHAHYCRESNTETAWHRTTTPRNKKPSCH